MLPEFLKRWPTPEAFAVAEVADIVTLCKPLGFANRRTANMKRMTEAYLGNTWDDVRELPGIGEYAARAFEIFCLGKLGDEAPKDHALVQYWRWVTQ